MAGALENAGYCGRCGWIHAEVACPQCGQAAGPGTPLTDQKHPALAGPRPEDHPELKNAYLAWVAKDWGRLMLQCFSALASGAPSAAKQPVGPGWSLQQGAHTLFVVVNTERETLSIESALVRVPFTRRVPLLRRLLELNYGDTKLARFCLRDNTVVLRVSDRLQFLPPPKLIESIRNVIELGARYGDHLAVAFDAEVVNAKLGQTVNWEAAGRSVTIGTPMAAEAPIALPVEALSPITEGASAADIDFVAGPGTEARELSPQQAEMVALLEHALREVDVARASGSDSAGTIERAAIFIAYDRFKDSCPDALSLLIGKLAPMLPVPTAASRMRGLLDRVSSVAGGGHHGALEPAIREVIAKGCDVGPQGPPALPRLKDAEEVKGLAATLLTALHKLPEQPVTREMVASGALCELLARGTLPELISGRLRAEIDRAKGGTGQHAKRLDQIIERVSQ